MKKEEPPRLKPINSYAGNGYAGGEMFVLVPVRRPFPPPSYLRVPEECVGECPEREVGAQVTIPGRFFVSGKRPAFFLFLSLVLLRGKGRGGKEGVRAGFFYLI